MEIDGVSIRAGDLVLLDNSAANHDPTVFTEPDRVDITREAAAHLTFGHASATASAHHWPAWNYKPCSPN